MHSAGARSWTDTLLPGLAVEHIIEMPKGGMADVDTVRSRSLKVCSFNIDIEISLDFAMKYHPVYMANCMYISKKTRTMLVGVVGSGC